jgi:hypothetical protein
MRTPALIAIVAVAALAVAWLLLTRSPQTPVAATPATSAPAPLPPPAPAVSDEREAAAVRAQTTIPPPEPGPVGAKSLPERTGESPKKPAESAATESAGGDEVGISTDDVPSDEPEPGDDDAESPSIDVDHAADLLADWMAKQDAATADDSQGLPSTRALKTFDEEEADPKWSAPTTQQIEATLHQWLDTLPEDVRDHVDVIHVECRLTLCQILAAENEITAPDEQSAPTQEWLQAIDTLPHQPWWSELGFVDFSTAVNRMEADGYFLYQTYLRRDVKPAG